VDFRNETHVSVAGVISEDEAVALRSPFAVLKKS
jgi:hypothetical protein